MIGTSTHLEAQGIGLMTANPADKIALRGVRLRARVAGMSLKATVEQTFVNLEGRAIEAVYTFPLPESAAVCGFEVVFFDKVFTGVVEESNRAIEQYDDAIAEGHGAYLMEQHRPDVFSVRVGNLKPRQAVTIRLSYVMDVEIVDRAIRLAFPTTIAPRYATASGMDPIDAAIEADAMNPPHVLSVPYGLSMEVEIDLGKSLRGITSPSHAIGVSKAGVVTFAGTMAEMNRDVVLNLELAREQEPFALAATSAGGERFVALNFLPEFDEADLAPVQSETVFVLDCSGSMQGESIAQATAALECCLRSMSAGDRFNVCRFGSTFEMLGPEPLIYSAKTLADALAFIAQGANLGGTELAAPLEAIFGQKPSAGAVRNVVLLTDGQVTNEPALLAQAKRKRLQNRLFTFGIGSAASAFLVNGLARVTGGAAEFIAPGERIEDKVLRTFGRLSSPPVTDVEIDWGNADAQVAPRRLGPLFDGDALRAFARVSGRLPETVTLKCNTPAGPRSWQVAVREGADPANVLPTLWARVMIRALEEEEGVAASASISAGSEQNARLIELSKRYNLLCGLTSFIAIEHRSLEDRNEGKPALRRVPVMLAAGWGGVEEGTGLSYMTAMPAPSPAQSYQNIACGGSDRGQFAAPSAGSVRLSDALPGGGKPKFFSSLRKMLSGKKALKGDSANAAQPQASRAAREELGGAGGDWLVQLLALQAAEGFFNEANWIDGEVQRAGVDVIAIHEAIEQMLKGDGIRSSEVAETVLILSLFQILFPDRQSTWNRAAKKALRWLETSAGVSPQQAQTWLASLEATFGKRA